MKRTILLAAVAATALLAGGASAQNQSAPAKTDAPAALSQKMDLKGSYRSSKLIGLNVYNNADEKLGDINEVIIDHGGKVSAFIIGVGGFLGIGEHDIAVAPDKLKFVEEPRSNKAVASDKPADSRPATTGSTAPAERRTNASANDWTPDHALLNATKDQLKAMPQFKYSD